MTEKWVVVELNACSPRFERALREAAPWLARVLIDRREAALVSPGAQGLLARLIARHDAWVEVHDRVEAGQVANLMRTRRRAGLE